MGRIRKKGVVIVVGVGLGGGFARRREEKMRGGCWRKGSRGWRYGEGDDREARCGLVLFAGRVRETLKDGDDRIHTTSWRSFFKRSKDCR